MEYFFRNRKSNLTEFCTIQPVEALSEAPKLFSLDCFFTKGVPGRLTGVGPGSEARVLSPLALYLHKSAELRDYSIFLQGGDAYPQAHNEEELVHKHVVALGPAMNKFMRGQVSRILGQSLDRNSITALFSNEPECLNELWNHPLLQQVTAFLWRADITLRGGRTLEGVHLVTVRDTSSFRHVHCRLLPNLNWQAMPIVLYASSCA